MSKNLTFEELVTACYRGILEREPESPEVVRIRAAQIDQADEMLRSFVLSEEFQSRPKDGPPVIRLSENYIYDRLDIDVEVSDDQLQRMFTRIAAEWKALGEAEPHWSVLTWDEFKGDRIAENLDSFYGTGQANVDWMQNIARRNGITLGPGQTCLELGCGVGRITLPLSDLFDHVIGVDISPGNLAEAQAVIDTKGTTNIALMQLNAIEEIGAVPDYDVLFSIIVLQHNPPPVQRYMLKALLEKLRPGGAAYFQLPTYLPDYRFEAESYLASPSGGMEMHAVPMKDVLALLRENGCTLLEVLQDDFTGLPGSHSFFAVKDG